MANRLSEELNVDTVFTIPILGGIAVAESVVVTWIIMAVVTLLSIIFVRNLEVWNPGKKQLLLEIIIGWMRDFFRDILGKEGLVYAPYLMTVILYLAISNMIGIFGFKPPTKDLNVTAALAIMSIVLIEYAGFRKKGPKNFVKGFAKPVPVVLPINILEIFIKPVSLCMRLFGNVLGGFVVMELVKAVVPLVIPVAFSFYFDIFDGLIQAYVFVFLTGLFIQEAME